MSALRFGSGSAGLGTDAPYLPQLTAITPQKNACFLAQWAEVDFAGMFVFGSVAGRPCRRQFPPIQRPIGQ